VHGQPRQSDRKQRRQGATGKATIQQRIQWGELTRVQMAHWRDEADESRGYHPVLMVNEYCGTGRPATMNTGWHRRLSQRPGLFFGVLVPVGPQLQTPAARIKVVVGER